MGLLLAWPLFALESFDSLTDVKLLRVLPNNIVVLNRGIEDGVVLNDHAKLSNEIAGFSSRTLCLRASRDLSFWKLYRIPNAQAFSKDYTYVLTGLSDREMPLGVAQLREREQTIPDTEKKRETPSGADPFAIKQDLPEKLSERDLLEPMESGRRKLFIEENFNKEQLKKDLSQIRLSFFASPFMKQSINESESLRYGFRGGNTTSKYRLLTQFEQQETKLTDSLTKESVSTKSTSGQVQFVIHHLTPTLSSLSLVNFNSQSFSKLGTPKAHWQFGVVGLTWHFNPSKTWEYLDLSYIPLFDVRTTEFLKVASVREEKKIGLRHGVRFGLKTRVNEKVALENILWVRPFQDLASWDIEGDNLNLTNDLKLIFSLTDNLFFDYNLVYQKDKLWKTLNNLPDNNTINSINLRYDIDL